MITRDERQAENIQKWKDVGCVGTLEACTGYGKTRVALKAMKRLQDNYNINALVVVPTVYLKNQWEERIQKFGLQHVDVKTIQSIIRGYSPDSQLGYYTLLIPDEIHKYVAEEFGKLYDIVDYSIVLGLTATVPDDERKDIIEEHAPVFDKVSVEEAKTNGWVSDFIIYQLGIKLDPEEQAEYDKITDKFYKNFSWFNHDWDKVKKTLNKDNYANWWAKKQGIPGQEGRMKGHASRVMSSVQERKSMLYCSQSKLDAAVEVLNKFPQKKAICFSERIEFADWIHEEFPERAVAYHSSIEGREIDDEYYGVERLKERRMDLFKDESSNVNILSTARALDMGVDVPDMDLGIITSASSKSLQAVQRIGRVIRHQEDKVATIVDIFAKDTQDEFWLRNRYDEFPNSSIKRISNTNEIRNL